MYLHICIVITRQLGALEEMRPPIEQGGLCSFILVVHSRRSSSAVSGAVSRKADLDSDLVQELELEVQRAQRLCEEISSVLHGRARDRTARCFIQNKQKV